MRNLTKTEEKIDLYQTAQIATRNRKINDHFQLLTQSKSCFKSKIG